MPDLVHRLTTLGNRVEQFQHNLSKYRLAGERLPPKLLRFFESAFGQSLAQVRVHCDARADAFNRQLGSLAFAHGEHLYFRRNNFAPQTRSGLWLLAHELTHVLQQRGSTSASATPAWTAALEREANDAACAVVNGQQVVVLPRDGCPSIQRWEIDMHLTAVYLAGRSQSMGHKKSLRIAWASQSLDDSDDTAADKLKIWGRDGWDRSKSNRYANNAHALGLTLGFAESEEVAREGINTQNDLLFGLGLHTVGDFLAHANLAKNRGATAGHQRGWNENCGWSADWISDSDFTHNNPRKALDTIFRFMGLLSDFQTRPFFLAPVLPAFFVAYVQVPAGGNGLTEKAKLIKNNKAQLSMTDADFTELELLWAMEKSVRKMLWRGPDTTTTLGIGDAERTGAENTAERFWLSRPNDSLLRTKVDDVTLASGSWGNVAGGYGAVPIPQACTCRSLITCP